MAKYIITVHLINGKVVQIETDEHPTHHADGMIWIFTNDAIHRYQFVANNVLYIDIFDKQYSDMKEGK